MGNMKTYTAEEIKERMAALGLKFFHNEINLVSIREREPKPDAYNDKLYLIWGQSIYEFTCTTIPGVHWLQNFLNKSGTAVLKSDAQYVNAYQLGKHKGEDALVQVKPVTVYRDVDKDKLAEEIGILDTGLFGINIHGANKNIVSVVVGKWSAGCTVVNNPSHMKTLITVCKKSIQKYFTYTVLKEW